MNQTGVLVAIGLVVAAVILWPLLRRSGRTSPSPPALHEPRDERFVPPDELAELELDRAMGRIGDADYERLKARHQATSTAPAVTPVAAETPQASSRAEDLVRKWHAAPRPTCPTCGVRPEAEARYCSNCGTAIDG